MEYEEKVREVQDTGEEQQASQVEVADDASIYHYMKEHPGFLAAVISAIIAVIAFVLNAAEYRRISSYLNYWGFNVENIQIETGSHIYVLVLTFVFIIALAGVALFLNQSLTVFQKQENVLFYLRMSDKYLRREIAKVRFDNYGIQFWISFCSKKGADRKKIAELETKLHEQNHRLEDLKERTKSSQKTIRSLRKYNLIRLLPSLFITWGLLLLLLGLAGFTDDLKASIRYPYIGLCIVVVILMGLMYGVVCFENRAERKRIKQLLKSDDKEAAIHIEELAERNRKCYPAEWIFRSNVEELLKNKTITGIAVFIIVCLAYTFAIFCDPGDTTTISRRTFSVVDVDGQKYVITYNCDTTYYLNEAEIDSDRNSINIYTKKQRVVASDDMVYDIVEFNSVEVDPPIAGNEDQQPSEAPDSSVTESE